jgi:hypothetical protein
MDRFLGRSEPKPPVAAEPEPKPEAVRIAEDEPEQLWWTK